MSTEEFNENHPMGNGTTDGCPEGTFDVRTVAMHEFGRWLVLDDKPGWKVWDNDCAKYGWLGADHTLCGHDKEGIKEIYGTD